MTAIDSAVGRLGGDDELGLDLIHVVDVLPAHAVAVLFLNRSHNHYPVAFRDEAEVLHDSCSVCGRCHSAFLVGAAAAVDDLVVLIALVGICGPVVDVSYSDGIDVGIDGDDLVAFSHPSDYISETVNLNLVIAELLHLFLDSVDNALLLTAFRGNCNHVSQESGHVGTVFLCSFLDGIKIHLESSRFSSLRVTQTPPW